MGYVRTKLRIKGKVVEVKDISRPWRQGDQERWDIPCKHAIVDEEVWKKRFVVAKEYIESGIVPVPILHTYKDLFAASTTITLTGFVNVGLKETNVYFEYWEAGVPETIYTEPASGNPYSPLDPTAFEEANADLTGLTPDTTYYARLKGVCEFGTFYDNIILFATTT